MSTTLVASALEHIQVTDALLRFAAGADAGDVSLMESAFAQEAEIDFAPCGESLGLEFGLLSGRPQILDFLQATAKSQVTSHVVSNARVERNGEGARLQALVDAKHLTREETPSRFRMMNRYSSELIRQEHLWLIRTLRITNVWFDGDPRTLLFRKEQNAPPA